MSALETISWSDVERITRGRLGRSMAVCPLCSADRRTPQKRNSKVLAVKLLEPNFAVWFCNHCGANGFSYPENRERIVDIVERQRPQAEAERHARGEREFRKRQALALWTEAQPFRGSPAEAYLADTRGIGEWLDTFPYLDQVFRYHADCPFGGNRRPCMLALVRDIKSDDPVAIHRTALTVDDPPQRIGRMSFGPISGGAIKVSPDCEVHAGLMIGEGIETILGASKQFQFRPIWSLIDAGNLAKFLPLPGIECVTIAVDNDEAGQEAARKCAETLTAANVEVITAKPSVANDFNDVVRRAGHAR